MEGHGLNDELPDSLRSISKNVWIFHGYPIGDENLQGGLGKWEVLLNQATEQASCQMGCATSTLKNLDLNFLLARKLEQLYPGEKIALIKYARGGSSIDSLAAREYGSWEIDFRGTHGINQFDHFLTTVKGALSTTDIDGNGMEEIWVPAGIIWMQGESDATLRKRSPIAIMPI